jgi:hypothetical protein
MNSMEIEFRKQTDTCNAKDKELQNEKMKNAELESRLKEALDAIQEGKAKKATKSNRSL